MPMRRIAEHDALADLAFARRQPVERRDPLADDRVHEAARAVCAGLGGAASPGCHVRASAGNAPRSGRGHERQDVLEAASIVARVRSGGRPCGRNCTALRPPPRGRSSRSCRSGRCGRKMVAVGRVVVAIEDRAAARVRRAPRRYRTIAGTADRASGVAARNRRRVPGRARRHLAVREQVPDAVVAVREDDAMVDRQHAIEHVDELRFGTTCGPSERVSSARDRRAIPPSRGRLRSNMPPFPPCARIASSVDVTAPSPDGIIGHGRDPQAVRVPPGTGARRAARPLPGRHRGRRVRSAWPPRATWRCAASVRSCSTTTTRSASARARSAGRSRTLEIFDRLGMRRADDAERVTWNTGQSVQRRRS